MRQRKLRKSSVTLRIYLIRYAVALEQYVHIDHGGVQYVDNDHSY